MKIIIDKQIIKTLLVNPNEMLKNPLLADPNNEISFKWPTLLESLDLRSLTTNLPSFNPTQPLYDACFLTLSVNEEKEDLYYLYDSLFTECLNQIRDLSQINSSFLLKSIQKQIQKGLENRISRTLKNYELAFIDHPSRTMHDLILYLAWDRMCRCIARLFDDPSSNPIFIKSLTVLKECLIESYLHIARQGKTSPSIYRLIESLFFYQIRQENMQKHEEAGWALLGQSFPLLTPEDFLGDFFYIDDAAIPLKDLNREGESPESYLTFDSQERVNARLTLSHYLIDQLKLELPEWDYVLKPKRIAVIHTGIDLSIHTFINDPN